MKKIFSIILALLLPAVSVFSASAAASNNGLYSSDMLWQYSVNDDGTIQIDKYLGSDDDVIIPQNIDGKTVTSIAKVAFYNSKIEKITFPDSLKTVGWWAFYGCENLAYVSLNKGLYAVSYGAFLNCPSLRAVTIPYTVSYIGNSAFGINCSTTKNIKDIYSKKSISRQYYFSTENFSVIGYDGTYAQKYAEDYDFQFNTQGSVLFGDADLNGKTDKSDVQIINDYLGGKAILSDAQSRNCDIDGDGSVTQTDLDFIEKYTDNYISYYNFPATENLSQEIDYLNGKTLYCDGDSIAKGTGTNILGNDFYSYCYYLRDKHNMLMTNNAVAGTTLARQENKTEPGNRSILERVLEMQGDYDVIVLDGGFNDLFQKIEPGTVTDFNDRSGVYDEYTTAGALESICYFLNKNYSDSVKLFVLCHDVSRYDQQSRYWDVIRSVLDKWDIDYIDFSKETDFCDVTDDISSQYFMYNSKLKSGDGIHPNKFAVQTLYGPMIDKKLNSLAGERVSVSFDESKVQIGLIENYCQTPLNIQNYNSDELKWSSDNEEVATVDEYGTVKAENIGTTTIRLCTPDGKTAKYELSVNLMAMDLEMEHSLVLKQGGYFTLNPKTFLGTTAYHKNYFSSNPQIAGVGLNDGLIYAKQKGKAVITCKLINGVVARCKVTVI